MNFVRDALETAEAAEVDDEMPLSRLRRGPAAESVQGPV